MLTRVYLGAGNPKLLDLDCSVTTYGISLRGTIKERTDEKTDD
jgi:hypothetical protein